MSTITVKNIGPIQQLSIPVPEDGGVVVLRGGHGSGKSTVLRAVQAAEGKRVGDLPLRDGARRGEIECGGVHLVVTKSRTARGGELEVESIESRYDIGRLVDPQIQDEERADAARIKQLVALSGAHGDVDAYFRLVKSKFNDGADEFFNAFDAEIDDPLELYRRFVQYCQGHARALETEAAKAIDTSSLESELGQFRDLGECSIQQAQSDQEAAAVKLAEIEQQVRSAANASAAWHRAQQTLAALENNYLGRSSAEAAESLQAFQAEFNLLSEKLADTRKWMTAAQNEYAMAVQHEEAVAKAKSIVAEIPNDAPASEEVDWARMTVEQTRTRTHRVVKAMELNAKLGAAVARNVACEQARKKAEALRQIAKDAEGVLADSLPSSSLRVHECRLVTRTDRSDDEYFSELSHGERAIIAIDLASQFVPRGGICTISQEVWGGLSDEAKAAVSVAARQRGVTILTAEVTDEDRIEAEVL